MLKPKIETIAEMYGRTVTALNRDDARLGWDGAHDSRKAVSADPRRLRGAHEGGSGRTIARNSRERDLGIGSLESGFGDLDIRKRAEPPTRRPGWMTAGTVPRARSERVMSLLGRRAARPRRRVGGAVAGRNESLACARRPREAGGIR